MLKVLTYYIDFQYFLQHLQSKERKIASLCDFYKLIKDW